VSAWLSFDKLRMTNHGGRKKNAEEHRENRNMPAHRNIFFLVHAPMPKAQGLRRSILWGQLPVEEFASQRFLVRIPHFEILIKLKHQQRQCRRHPFHESMIIFILVFFQQVLSLFIVAVQKYISPPVNMRCSLGLK